MRSASSRVLATLVALALAGCATAPPGEEAPTPPPTLGGEPASSSRVVDVFYGTDRSWAGLLPPYYTAARASDGRVAYGVCQVNVRPENRLLRWLTRFIHENPSAGMVFEMTGVTPLSADGFFRQLRGRLARRGDALLFIHGYNVTFKDACERTAQLSYDLEFPGAPLMWSWPSKGGITTMIPDYFKDEADNEWSIGHLREFLVRVSRESGVRRLHIIAHSMGARLLMNATLRILGDPELRRRVHIENLIFAAPDVDADVFVELAPVVRQIAQRTTLYASSRDQALRISQEIHGYPRAGGIATAPVVVSGIDTIDASVVDTSLLGHSYYADSRPVVSDIQRVLDGEDPELRQSWLRQETCCGGTAYWRFTLPE